MELVSIKRNYAFNLLRNFSMILFPIIIFPYLSRILQPEGIGKINFANAVIQYFVMFSSLGIPLYGTREIAKVRDDNEKLSKTVNELLQINLISTTFAYLLFILFFVLSKKIQSESLLFFITSSNIIFTNIGIEWFYQGIEKYKFITKRVILIRIISIALIFILVKAKDDYIISAAITVIGTVGGNLFNFIYARKYIRLSLISKYDLKRHIKPILTVFGLNIATSIYINLDSVMLGFIKGDEAVGFYTVAIKLNKLVLSIITSLGAVLMPRLSYYISNNKENEYKAIIQKALDLILCLSIPAVIGLILISKNIIILFSGRAFLEATITMQIITPIILFIALTNFIGIQILYPLNKEKIVLYSVIVGAVINFSLNITLIPKYSQNGAAIATTIAEFCVLAAQIILGRKHIKIKLISKTRLIYLLSSIIMGFIIWIVKDIFSNIVYHIIFSFLIGTTIYFLLLILFKDKLILEESKKVIRRFKFNV